MAEKINAIFVICEYNPFHYGHEYQLSELKRRYDAVICVMSGDAVQRGEAAVYPKYARARAAVKCGADAVFELPYPFSCMAAPDFALAGVYTAASLGCERLAFSADCELAALEAAADAADVNEVCDYLKKSKNLSYPKAVAAIIKEKAGDISGFDPTAPNNILGIEYLRAAKKLGIKLGFDVIRRNYGFESSSCIRGFDDLLSRIPKNAAATLAKYDRRDMSVLSPALMSAARRLHRDSDVYGLTADEVMRLKNASLERGNALEAVKAAASATMTEAKARRGMLCALLEITRSDALSMPLFTRLLALNENGARYISQNKKRFSLPVVSKRSHFDTLCVGAKEQNDRALEAEAVLALASRVSRPFDTVNRDSIMITMTD